MSPAPLFAKVSPELDFPSEERAILRFWKERAIFEKTLAKPAPRGTFVFYEGPPTANGMPHNGHVLTRVIKDVFPRYRTMRGYSVPRKAGWDTHGLPVEVEVEKELRIHGKAAIEEYGVEPFIKKCIESVFRYTTEWEELTERVAFWVDMKEAYVTYHRSYVESVWWALSTLHDKGLLYQGHKVVWWWAQGGTALSSGEVGQGYKTVDDPSVYVAFPVVGEENLSLLVWTTTPWTLPSNMYAAVNPKFDYVVVEYTQEVRRKAAASPGYETVKDEPWTVIVANDLVDKVARDIGAKSKVIRKIPGAHLVGKEYRPPFALFAEEARGWENVVWRVIAADFVTLDTGTGIVHIAPAFGEDDHEAHRRIQRDAGDVPLFCAVKPDGTFVERFERYAGRWVKDCDKEIQHDLKDAGLLVHAEQYRHDYPFCWRADSDPLIQYARPAWYIRTTALKDKAIENNRAVEWHPDHIKEGRFGDFLANNVDWALSRERWWGTPLNVWICEKDPEHREAPASVAAIEARNPQAFAHFHRAREADPTLSEHLIVHKPWVDQVTFPCAACGGAMRRVPEVIDCWFDSGCMPFAQWGYPHQNREKFAQSYPADFISEAIDQTRGWFYSLLMIATLVFDEPLPRPFKTCVVLGHVSDKEGKKESKSKGNYTPPDIILDEVKMDFAVVDAARYGVAPPDEQTAIICNEDLEGMDLASGATVEIRSFAGEARFALVGAKKLPRRVVLLHENALRKLAVVPTSTKDVKPVEVPWLDREQRVTVKDPSTTAPGADAFRWFFYAASPPWSATRHSLSNVRALQKEFAVKLRNVYSFFTIYAGIDGFDPSSPGNAEPTADDRWIASELATTVRDVTVCMDGYDVFGATQHLVGFVDALSNWWVRRSRARFWRSGWDGDKRSAYHALYRALVTLAKLTAPFTPYGAEAMYQNLVARAHAPGGRESVHLEDWPEVDAGAIDEALSRKMRVVRELVSIGLRARTDAKIKVRQPLRRATILLNDERDAELVRGSLEAIREELNVLEVRIGTDDDRNAFGKTSYKPNFRSLGQRGHGKLAQELKKAWGAGISSEEVTVILQALKYGKATRGDVEIHRDDIEVAFEPNPGVAAAADRVGSVFLDTQLDDELRGLGFVRELLNRIQTMRKEMGLEYADRIRVRIDGSERVRRIVGAHEATLAREVLAVAVAFGPATAMGGEVRELDVEGEAVVLEVARA
ncbi:MAG: isoleucine--tRNA ligase [Polyangiaceae bacterium]|jgi:isoleucyl-tRNA synthetase